MFDVHFVRKGWKMDYLKISIFPQFLTFDVHFARKECVSWKSGGPAPALETIQESREGDLQFLTLESPFLQTCKDVDLQMFDDVGLQMRDDARSADVVKM